MLARSAHAVRAAVLASLGRGNAPRIDELRTAVEAAYAAPVDDAAFADMVAQALVCAIAAAGTPPANTSFAPFASRGDVVDRIDALIDDPGCAGDALRAAVAGVRRVLETEAATAFASGRHDGVPGYAVLDFYESFLAEYDPRQRARRGVYFTPKPVVRYIVRAVADVLDDAFGISLDTPNDVLTVLDPACGTGAFLHEVVELVRARCVAHDDAAGWRSFVRWAVDGGLVGLEVLPAPYVVAHRTMTRTLHGADASTAGERSAYEPASHERPHIRLANALESLAAGDAGEAAGGAPAGVLVVLGNPPYAGHSANPSAVRDGTGRARPTAIGRLVREYLDGVTEANVKWLHDDYVKFVRFAEDRVERAGRGVVAFVTSHAYLDNPTFAGMRRHLMRTFDDIYVLDLHGNAKIGETAPDGSRDANVFDVQQGIAIGIFVKRQPGRDNGCAVRFAERFGDRASKYAWLATATTASTRWTAVTASAPAASFRPARASAPLGYDDAPSLAEAMPVSSLGVLTKRDALAVAFTPRELLDRLAAFASASYDDAEAAALFGLPLRDQDGWDLARARRLARDADPANVRPIQYRCGDVRYYYDAAGIVARRNRRVLDHVAGPERCALLVGRQGGAATGGAWDSVWATALSSDQNLFRRGGATVFPLIAGDARPGAGDGLRWNLSPAFVAYVRQRTDALDDDALRRRAVRYVYGLLHAPSFRAGFGGELKRDFPRVPVVDAASFAALSAIGGRLLRLHLLTETEPAVTFSARGDEAVVEPAAIAFADADAAGYGVVTVDAAGRRFERVHRHAWERTCGGSPVLASFLRARAGRRLAGEDVRAFAVLATVLDRERPLLARAGALVSALLRTRFGLG